MRWGFVGTGRIARRMAEVVRQAPAAALAAVASRRTDTARAFAMDHGAARAFDAWQDMLGWDGIDAVYLATPTCVREAIAVAAAEAGKHVLGEKPFAGLASLNRVTAACRENRVCFMDATHFVHHPRFVAIRDGLAGMIGAPRSLDSRFLIRLTDRTDIRYDPDKEPLGALGDLGWYNMRATLEYLPPEAGLRSVTASLQRDELTGAVVKGEGQLVFDDGSESNWQFSFMSDGVDIGLRLSGPLGKLRMDDFVGENPDGSADYRYIDAAGGSASERLFRLESHRCGPGLMFEAFADAAEDPSLRERWIRAAERTQELLERVLKA